jgi:hypothetical protein
MAESVVSLYPDSPLQDDEQYWTDQLIAILRANLIKDYPPGTRTLRDAHTKAHGCLRAEFIVNDNVPSELRVGVFAVPRTYEAWIRFSSSANSVRPDTKRDVLGMAIKLPDVGPAVAHQDFLLTSSVAFMARTLAEFYGFMAAFFSGSPRLLLYALHPGHWRLLWLLATGAKRFGSPLTSRFWSMSAYRLGSHAVKYSVRPQQTTPDRPPHNAGPDYLRDAIKTQLAAGGASFDFMVQLRSDASSMPIDDPSVAWSETQSPFRAFATIRIPPQDFDTPERWEFGDNLSFAPWHCLPEHAPLGVINRARKRAYEVLSAFRHGRNADPQPLRMDPADTTQPAPSTDRFTTYPLLSALLNRRTRRFGMGMTLNGGPLEYASRRPVTPLTVEQEAALAFAACGITGHALGELNYTTGFPQAGGGDILAGFVGRAAMSGDAIQSIAVIVMNDEGTWLLPRPQDLAPSSIAELIALAKEHRLVEIYQRTRVKLADHRIQISPDMPYSPPFNRWDANMPGTTYFIPVMELSGLYINMILTAFSEEVGAFIRDERNLYRPAGIGQFAQSRGGHLHDQKTPIGYTATINYMEIDLLQFVTIEVGAILQNLSLMTEALGLGGFPHAAVHPEWMSLLGFDVEQVPFSKTIGANFLVRTLLRLLGDDVGVPTALGLRHHDGRTLMSPFCPPHYPTMEAAVRAFVATKYGTGRGIFRNGGGGSPWKDGAAIDAGIQEYSEQTLAATIAYCEYVYGRYGRFPCTMGPFMSLLAYQAHRLDPDFYATFYTPGALSSTQLEAEGLRPKA